MNSLTDSIKKCVRPDRWGRFVLLFLPPLILSWPLLPGNIPYPLKYSILLANSANKVGSSELPKELSIQGTTDSIGSKAFFSSILKMKMASMPIQICFSNNNEIFEGQNRVDPKILLDGEEAGAMGFKFHYVNSGLPDEIYVKLGEQARCRIVPADGVVLNKNGAEIRGPIGLKARASVQGQNVEINIEPAELYVRVPLNPGYSRIEWRTPIFVTNLIISLFAWWVVFISVPAMWKYLFSSQGKEGTVVDTNLSD